VIFWADLNHFQGFVWCEWCTLTSCHSGSALETIEWSMLMQVSSPYLPPFQRYCSQKKSLRKIMKMIMIIMNNQMKTPKV